MNWKVILAVTALLFSVTVSAQRTGREPATRHNPPQLRPQAHNRWLTESRYVLMPHAARVNSDLRAAQAGVASAQFRLALRYDSGVGVPPDQAEAAKWMRRAAEQGYAKAQYNLGCMYESGLGVTQDFVEAAKWFRKAAEQGYASAQKNLGAMYGRGQGVPQSNTEAFIWSSIAAESGDEGATANRDFAASQLTSEELETAQFLAAKAHAEILSSMDHEQL